MYSAPAVAEARSSIPFNGTKKKPGQFGPPTPAATLPLLVMDMYEHSYQKDFGAATARCVNAFFANIQWDAVQARKGFGARSAPGPGLDATIRP